MDGAGWRGGWFLLGRSVEAATGVGGALWGPLVNSTGTTVGIGAMAGGRLSVTDAAVLGGSSTKAMLRRRRSRGVRAPQISSSTSWDIAQRRHCRVTGQWAQAAFAVCTRCLLYTS